MSRLTQLGTTIVLSGLLLAVSPVPGAAQSFDDGSFGDSGGGGFPAPGGGGGAAPATDPGGFGESSFGEGGSGTGGGGGSFPEPGSGSGGGGGFEEGSFGEGGSGGTTPPSVVGVQPPAGGGGGPVTPPGGSDFNPPAGGDSGGTAPIVGGVQPPGGGGVQPPGGGGTQPPGGGGGAVGVAPQIIGFETRDFGVPPQQNLRNGQFHAPTPSTIPGANVVTTQDLAGAMQGGMQMVLIDVLGGAYGLPSSFTAPALASPGSFNDRVQQQANQWLRQITGGNTSVPVVVYCSDPMCWLSYNAALRVRASGFDNVYWYRGGLTAWEMAGLPLQPLGF